MIRPVADEVCVERGVDSYVVTSLKGSAKHLYETVYRGRGQAENFIKPHKAQLASDRTSCRDPRANQMRLIPHTAAYWLLLTPRAAAPKPSSWRTAEFTTPRLALIKIAAPRRRARRSHPPVAADGLPARYSDPPRRGSADAHRAIINEAAIAPDNPSRKSPAPTPETNNQRRNRRSESSRAHQASVAVRSRSGFVLNKGG